MYSFPNLEPKDRHPVGAAEGCGPQVRELGLRGAGNQVFRRLLAHSCPIPSYKNSNATSLFLRIKIEIHKKAGRGLLGLALSCTMLVLSGSALQGNWPSSLAREFPSPELLYLPFPLSGTFSLHLFTYVKR